MSISGNVDVDRNGMVDLAIGAFDSGSAVVLRSLEVMRLFLKSLLLPFCKMKIIQVALRPVIDLPIFSLLMMLV